MDMTKTQGYQYKYQKKIDFKTKAIKKDKKDIISQ